MGKKLLLVIALGLVLPVAAFADSQIDFSSSGGMLTGSGSGLSLNSSALTAVSGLGSGGQISGADLGSMSFTTGGLSSGFLGTGGRFGGGGDFAITGSGTNGIPAGALFSGAFSGPLTWSLTTLTNGTHEYTLSGNASGALMGAMVNGVTVQFSLNTGHGFYNGSTMAYGGTATVTVPEPGSLTLAGMGLVGLAGAMFFRKRHA
jgi:PEP-CTERM motif